MSANRRGAALILCILLGLASEGIAATSKKDFRGLFGNYRREQYVENEGRNSDFGMDLQLSTLIPVTPLVQSIESEGGAADNLKYATFFNLELGFFLTLNYHWELYGSIGYYSYDTRKENTVFTDPALPLFHQFEMTVIPAIGGIRYRFTTDDIVPYVGIGVGAAYTRRKGSYDYSDPTFNQQYLTALAGQAQAGVEFFIAARAGIRLEVAAYFMNLPAFEFKPGPLVSTFPTIIYKSNPWSVRYSSGIFVLF
jgi:outer membrane protein W